MKKRERLWKGSSNIGNDKGINDSEKFGGNAGDTYLTCFYMLINISSYTNFPLKD